MTNRVFDSDFANVEATALALFELWRRDHDKDNKLTMAEAVAAYNQWAETNPLQKKAQSVC